jgi:thioredoxin-like negative regulator of GroEL
MSRLTLTDPAITSALAGLEHVAVDIDDHPDLAAKYQVNAVPTFILLTASEAASVRTTGFQPAGDFLQWLTNGVAQVRADLLRAVRSQSELDAIGQTLAAPGTNSLAAAAAQLFDLCNERDDAVVTAAAGRMKQLADRAPAVLLDGLADPRLATRIQAANALHYKIGATFDIDPWSPAAARATNILVWRGRLTANEPEAAGPNPQP